MVTTTVSSKFQIVIPKEIRKTVPVEKGQVFQVLTKGTSITLVPDRPLRSLRGSLKGACIENVREKNDRL